MNAFSPPKLRDDLPRYPGTLQLLRVTGVTIPGPGSVGSSAIGTGNIAPGSLYVASTQQLRTDTLAPRDREPCLADDVNQVGLAPGYYLGRLAGSYQSLPVYEVAEDVNTSVPGGSKLAYIQGYSLTTSWTNIGTSLVLPPNTMWMLMAQINAQMVSSSTGTGDTISCRFHDGGAMVGCPVEFCDAVCANLTFVDAAPLVTIYSVSSAQKTVSIQGIVNTSTGSIGIILGCGALAGGQMVGMRVG